MPRPPSADSILRNMKAQQFEPKTPIARDMFLPNHSGIAVHPEAVANFVPYSGAISHVNLGSKNITTTGSIIQGDYNKVGLVSNLLIFFDGAANEYKHYLQNDGNNLYFRGYSTMGSGALIIDEDSDSNPIDLKINGGEIYIYRPTTNDYKITSDEVGHLAIVGLNAAAQTQLSMYTADSDGTDGNFLNIYGKGTAAASVTNYEKLAIGYGASSQIFSVRSLAGGTGTVRPLYLYTGANTSQMVLAIDGKVGIGKAPTTYALEVSGEIQPTTNYRSTDGSAGLTQTFTGAEWAAKTSIVFKNGLLISTSTC